MSQIIKNEDGTESEVYSKEETEQMAEECAKVEAERIVAEKEEEYAEILRQKEEEKAELEQKLEKEQSKDRNFKQLRQKTEKQEEEEAETKKTIAGLQERLSAMERQPFESAKSDFVEVNVENTKEKRELFDYFYKKTSVGAQTKEDIVKALKEAKVLYDSSNPVGNNDAKMTSVSPGYEFKASETESETARQIAQNLGVTEVDKKKYGKGTVNLF